MTVRDRRGFCVWSPPTGRARRALRGRAPRAAACGFRFHVDAHDILESVYDKVQQPSRTSFCQTSNNSQVQRFVDRRTFRW